MKPITIFKNLKERYLLFLLTTVAKNNLNLFNELKEYWINNDLINANLYINKNPQYITVNAEIYDKINFNNHFKDYLKNNFKTPYIHQIKAWNNLLEGKNLIVSTGTGSGKSEAFLYPIINHCMNQNKVGIKTIIIYPLKSLASDQGDRLGKLLDKINLDYNKNITFGILDGDAKSRKDNKKFKSEIAGREEILNKKPDILITNYVMLERLLINPTYLKLFEDSNIKFLVLDEIHYYSGAQGIDVSLLIRRLQYFLKQNNSNNLQYIGTSATLGNPDSKEFTFFLKNLFNIDFKSSEIITPQYDPEFLDSKYSRPTKLDLNDLNDNNLNNLEGHRTHSFFSAPNAFFRCQDCNFLTHIEEEKCPKCKSKEIYEIATCRQCGFEYFIYNYEIDSNMNRSESILLLELLKKNNHTNEYNSVILSKTKTSDSDEIGVCTNCGLLSGNSNSCSECNNKLNKYYLNLYDTKFNRKKINDNYCNNCDIKQDNSLIVPISKVSDENCSHVIFNELFLEIPKDHQKLLIFTDNVQRSSKFAREIEETHIKNLARTFLLKELNNLNSEIKLSNLIRHIINEMEEEFQNFDFDSNIHFLEKELYEEIFSKGKKVASLKNRNLFNIYLNLELNTPFLEILFEILSDKFQTRKYYDLKDKCGGYNEFYSIIKLKERIYRIYNNLENKRINFENVDFSEINFFLNDCLEKDILIFHNDIYLLSDKIIFLKKNLNSNLDININYYDSWVNKTNLPIINAKIDTGKISAEERKDVEKEFKSKNNKVNLLIATPTLELGIDIGGLDVVGLLYAPPSPAQYVQRVGRAGRSGNSNFVLTYLSKRTVDSMYFKNPEILIKGEINPPSFLINLESPMTKSLFSLSFYYLLNKTDFIKKFSNWSDYTFWLGHFNEIKLFIESIYSDLISYLDSYLKFINNDTFILDNYLNNVLNTIEDFIKLEKNFNKSGSSSRFFDIFNFLQSAGVLPDYAFGSGGVKLFVNSNYSIDGYSLTETSPPSTLDHNKIKYKSKGFKNLNWTAKEISDGYLTCSNCNNLIYLNQNLLNCTLCNNELKKQNERLIAPKLIELQKTRFGIEDKRTKWKQNLVNCPNNLEFNSKGVSKPFISEINQKFAGVFGSDANFFICEVCGNSYDKESEKCPINNLKHKRLHSEICEQLKTRILLLKIPEKIKSNKITLLNSLISSLVIITGSNDGQISGFELEGGNYLVFYDNVDGGVGFIDSLITDFDLVIKKALKLCESECCRSGCVRCIGSYRRQFELNKLNKSEIIPYLEDILKNNLQIK